jgi:hypothetical protein
MSVSQNYHVPVYIKGAVPSSLDLPWLGLVRGGEYPQRGCDAAF